MPLGLQTDHVVYEIGDDGRNLRLLDRATGADYCAPARSWCAEIVKGGRRHRASSVSWREGGCTVRFGRSGVSAVIAVERRPQYLVFEVQSLSGDAEELAFVNLPLTLRGAPDEPFACCALALNLQTNVVETPGASARLRAACYRRFGFAGAKAAVIACPQGMLRSAMQEVVAAAPDLPRSPIGGPWALDADINRGSYLFDFGRLSEQTVDEWIELVRGLGFDQVDFHGGVSFRFGDCAPNPEIFPRGYASMKAVIDRLHAAGISAGLHTYAFFIDKRCPWVTPVPDPRLATDAAFTLARDLDPQAATVPVVESTEGMSAVTGFFVRNSATLRIDDELITYCGVSQHEPYSFDGCERGACGTTPAAHERGAQVHHLKECFGLFVPDPDSTLLAEVAATTARAFNQCGFDMMYLDALDGEDILGGAQSGWHYGSRFVFELWRRLERPALMEMSTFHHHLWYVRSRLGAWDHPTRSHKRFIDIHCAGNRDNRRMFLPGQLGWWAVKTWAGARGEPTFPDDIEYLCCKALATDTGLSLMGVDPDSLRAKPALARLAPIFERWERLRRAGAVPEQVRARLRVPGREFTLFERAAGDWGLRPVQYIRHKVEGINGWSNAWRARNRFGRQPLQVRIEALMSAAPYDDPRQRAVADFADFGEREARRGVTCELQPSEVTTPAGEPSHTYSALNASAPRRGAWCEVARAFDPPLDLSEHQALGVWVHGDGQGQVLNFQLRSPEHLVAGIGEHYVVVDFAGWRYFELIEPEGERYADYRWPYGNPYAVYRESVEYGHVAALGLWYNNLPRGRRVACGVGPVRALPLASVRLINPALSIGGRTITFPTEIESGWYLEFRSRSDCVLYDPDGKPAAQVRPEGEVPELLRGDNEVAFTCQSSPAVSARARVTLIAAGQPLRGETG